MSGAFKVDHFYPVVPLFPPIFFNLFPFMLGGQFLLPHRANNQANNEKHFPEVQEEQLLKLPFQAEYDRDE